MAAKKQRGKGGGAKSKGSKKQQQQQLSNNSKHESGGRSRPPNKKKQHHHQHHGNNYDYDDDDAKFRNALLNQGHVIHEMNADGNCLFRSLSDQLYDDRGAKHDVIRHDVCNHLSKNKEEFSHFLLMDDDDEDVIDIDEYISKMREDGEWGGNVEVVVASRVYKRNIMLFSSEYSNGVLSITCDDKDKDDGDDLLLSYHGNDHYNSVRSIHKKQSTTTSKSNNSSSTSSSKSNKKKGGTKSIDEDIDATNATTNANNNASQSTTAAEKGRSRPPTRGSNCPCGSGLKYKKCCMSAEKSKKRLAKHLEEKQDDDDGLDEKKNGEFIGDFKVLSI
mmetsp:Transcript_37241/g.78542  ORF Transcript_37241/g.78542 Transcript_37241/m.78542 type:complete len:333 (-) Transcript_37241:115-1113(-)